jgi:periplasmic protein TonB
MTLPSPATMAVSSLLPALGAQPPSERPHVRDLRLSIVAAVVMAHAAALWALHNGLTPRQPDTVVPITVMAEVIEPAQAPATPPAAPAPPSTDKRSSGTAVRDTSTAKPKEPPRTAVPATVAAQTNPSETAPVTAAPVLEPTDPTTAVAQASHSGTARAYAAAHSAAPNPAPPEAKVELPSSKADYLNNPKPLYPKVSRNLGEQGLVVVRTLIGEDGLARRAEIKTSSGFERLDKVALETVLKWRYVPGKRNGEPEAMWFDVPIHFQLR